MNQEQTRDEMTRRLVGMLVAVGVAATEAHWLAGAMIARAAARPAAVVTVEETLMLMEVAA